jgi:hypothetical protein
MKPEPLPPKLRYFVVVTPSRAAAGFSAAGYLPFNAGGISATNTESKSIGIAVSAGLRIPCPIAEPAKRVNDKTVRQNTDCSAVRRAIAVHFMRHLPFDCDPVAKGRLADAAHLGKVCNFTEDNVNTDSNDLLGVFLFLV